MESQVALKVSTKVVKECVDFLVDLTSQFTIILQQVPRHNDIHGNCEANDLATAGATLQLDSGIEGIYIPLATCRYLIDKLVKDIAESLWSQSPTC